VLALAAAEEGATLRVHARNPLPVVLLIPSAKLGVIDPRALVRGLAARLEARSDLYAEVVEPERAADCAGAISCLIERTGSSSPLLLVLSAVKAKDRDRISATLVDAEQARREMRRSGVEDREAAISERAVLVRPEYADIAASDQLEPFLDRLIQRDLRPVLEARGAWEPFGGLVLEGAPAGAVISIDGAVAGVAQAGINRVEGIKPGARMIAVEHPRFEPASVAVEIARGELARVSLPELARRGSELGLRRGLFWTGIGASAAGVALVIAAAVSAGDTQVLCLTTDPEDSRCSGHSSFWELGGSPAAGGSRFSPERSGGVPLAPLGISLVAAGAGFTLGAAFLGEEQDPPWLALAIGLGAGALSFGLSIALDGETP
jgi:hypothetical protein